MPQVSRLGRMALILGVALVLAACSGQKSLTGSDLSITGAAATPGSPQQFVVTVGDRVFFQTDSVEFTPQAIATLNRQVQWLNQYPRYTFVIEGHADERGTREYNIALGARRAAAVQEFLIAQGVSPARLRTVSYGKERPLAICSDEACYAQNRRAVTVITVGGGV